jgi:hypothetical protein
LANWTLRADGSSFRRKQRVAGNTSGKSQNQDEDTERHECTHTQF